MKKLLPIFAFLLFLYSCQDEPQQSIPDVDHIEVDLELIRYDQRLNEIDSTNVDTELPKLINNYPEFSNIYFSNVLLIPKEKLSEEVINFNSDRRIRHLYDTTQQIIGDLDVIEEQFKSAMKFYKYYFPEKTIPNIYTFISEYAYQRFIFQENQVKDGLGIGLDMYLGYAYPYRQIIPNNPAFSKYLTRSFNKDHMVKKTMETLIEDVMGAPSGNDLLSQMIHNGKKLYILDQIMPFVSDTVIMEYSEKQLKWCLDNEVEMWAYLFDQELFYSTDFKKINKLVNPSPHSSGMPDEAPGRTANFMGWQIVKAYMRKFPETSLQELINKFDEQEILEQSRYKPRKR